MDKIQKIVKWIFIVISTTSCLAISYLCILCTFFILEGNHDKSYGSKAEYILYDHQTILEDISSGKQNLYTLTDDYEHDLYLNLQKYEPAFSEKEYFAIVRSASEQLWSANVDDWKITELEYLPYLCIDGYSSIKGLKFTFENEKPGYSDVTIVRSFRLNSGVDHIHYFSYFDPRPISKSGIVLNDMKISYDSAIELVINDGILDNMALDESGCQSMTVFFQPSKISDRWLFMYNNKDDDQVYKHISCNVFGHCTIKND